jgi:NADPH:quinone reductase-like Zn-dependent oxidoreductase
MRVIVYRNYGPADVVKCEEIAKPVAADDEVLIKVRAASLNPLDWRLMSGKPFLARLMAGGLRKPKLRPGVDVAGHVEAVGRNVTQFKPGDEVFGNCRGSFAEYACTKETALALKPRNATFEEAASVPIAGYTALQGLRKNAKVQAGQRILINGAAGGVGTFAVQIAKWLGAEVTGVCSTRNVDMVRAIGADHVIDYTQEDFTTRAERYDAIFDCIGNHTFAQMRSVLTPKGKVVMVGAHKEVGTMGLITPLVASLVRSQVSIVLARRNQADLNLLRELIEGGTIKPVIDKRYRLCETKQAVGYCAEGHARGKVVITVAMT